MKKLAILLSLVMVLGLAVSASAAVTGEVKYEISKQSDEQNFGWKTTYKVVVSGEKDAAKASIEFGDNDVALKKAWIDYKDDFGVPVAFKFGKFGVKEQKTVDGIQVDATLATGLTAGVLVLPHESKDKVGFHAKYTTSFNPVAVEAEVYSAKAVYSHKYKAIGKATYNLSDAMNVWGKVEYTDKAALSGGGEVKAAGATFKGEYVVDSQVLKLSAEKGYNGLTFAANYDINNKSKVNTLKGSVKVAF